ncbi:hypothetical protein [Pseudomonas sp. M30-35]|uniref:hypothetical protein n=1 Tax=Pseudomonas sp. M30-35 TaxID=1981174 RepID=UPI000B3CC879|nr:hypothetical protein [Pseudomonas sp. M30-35]ARU88461.1 hypothetical protein B9K09_11030 [Pseudomonas sp. M30-35]
MKPYLIFGSTLCAFTLLFSQLSQAEESASFVARNEQVQQQANDTAQREALAKHSRAVSKQQSDTTKDS